MKRLFYVDVCITDTYNGDIYHDRISDIVAKDSKEAAQMLRDKLPKKMHFDMEYLTQAYKYNYYREIERGTHLDNIQIDEEEYEDSLIYQYIKLYENMKVYPINEDTAIMIINSLRKDTNLKALRIQGLCLGSYYSVVFYNNAIQLKRYETHYTLDNNGNLIVKNSRREYSDYLPTKENGKFKIGDVVHIIYDELNIDFVVCDVPKPWFDDENWENMYTLYAKNGNKDATIEIHESELVKVNNEI